VQRAHVHLGELIVGGGAVTQRHLEAGVQLAHAERLGHVVVGALAERLDLAVL
jgi:hypothetical protein